MDKILNFITIKDDIYFRSFHLFIGSRKDFLTLLLQLNIKVYNKDIDAIKVSKGMMFFDENKEFIWISKKRIDYISHELTHHCQLVFKLINTKINFKNDEIFAYYYQYIFNKVLKSLKIDNRFKLNNNLDKTKN